MKYKVGDKVRIKSIDWYNKNKDAIGWIWFSHSSITFILDMSNFCGRTATIISEKQSLESFYKIDIDGNHWCWTDEMFDETYNENKMENKKVKITLPKNCEVEKVETSVEDGYLVVKYTPKEKFSPKDGDIIVTDGLICISDGTLLDIGCGVYCAGLRKGGISCYSDFRPFSEGYKENIRLATDIEKKLLFSEMERCCLKWNPEQKKLEKIRWRAERENSYYFINSMGQIDEDTERYWGEDTGRFEIGNYFQTKEEAQEYANKFKELLKDRL